jgi:pimeloyl-ACP methyl ester carboxylesterase
METTKSADGTVIAYDRAGDGPPLVICVGAFCARHTFVPPAALAKQFTVYTYDRRGRGDSGDTQPFSAEREYEDLAAVVTATGDTSPFIYGHSSGAAIALRTAAAGLARFTAIIAYEAPFANDETPPPAVADPAAHIRELVLAGRREDAARFWMTGIIHLPAEMVAHAPWIKDLAPLTHTLPYDIAITGGGVPVRELAKITAPVLILGGGKSPAWFQHSVREQTAAIAGAQLRMLDGYDHNAPPEVITPYLVDFCYRR